MPIVYDLAKKENPLAHSTVGTLFGAAKLGYHAFTDPTDTVEQRAERRMHMDDDMISMIPGYSTLIDIGEAGQDSTPCTSAG